MAIWMDMTQSLHNWKGGVVGIVRAELEIAKNMKEENPNVRFCKFDGIRFVEVTEEELSWLWETKSVGDGYLKAMNRNQKAEHVPQVNHTGIAKLRAEHSRLDNAYNFSGSRIQRLTWGMKLYANTLPSWACSLAYGIINVLSVSLNGISKIYVSCRDFGKKRDAELLAEAEIPTFSHPFTDGDTVFSCGWIDSGKEAGFEKVKQELPDLKLVYLVYDIILIRENTRQFYHPHAWQVFTWYLEWVSKHCDAIFYGGKTAMLDTQKFQKDRSLPSPPGFPVYFGSDIVRFNGDNDEVIEQYAKDKGIKDNFILAVGSLDERKNYSTLYRAMTILAEREPDTCPQLVIVGKGVACKELLDTMERDPRTKDRIILLAPSDEQLDWLYRKAKLFVLASTWEGWSLTLPEALQYNKLTIAADVDPLREAGEPYVVFADTFDPFDWADKISYYINHPEKILSTEQKLEKEYHAITWKECGIQVANLLHDVDSRKSIFMDMSLAYSTAVHGGNITGILRTELMLAKNLYSKYPQIRFFAVNSTDGYIPIRTKMLQEILNGDNLDSDFELCRIKLKELIDAENDPIRVEEIPQDKIDALWFFISLFPYKLQKKLIAYAKKKKQKILQRNPQPVCGQNTDGTGTVSLDYNVPFHKGDVVFTAGIDLNGELHKMLLATKEEIGYRYCPVIYDYTPILYPQVHQLETVEKYVPFLVYTSNMADFIFYGGETARNDGIRYQKLHDLHIPPSCAIKFGSNIKQAEDSRNAEKPSIKVTISGKNHASLTKNVIVKQKPSGKRTERQNKEENASSMSNELLEKEKAELEILNRMGIKKPYIITVGTIEARKNHETLYRAYLRMIEDHRKVPQLVFCGYPGWNTSDFMTTLSRDDRVKGKILQIAPTDEELDILYRHCQFTVLASMYEGWSLTLPESYWYGKFCLCCDTPALRETAGDLAEYIHCWDEKKWAERIHYYHTHPAQLEKCEQRIANEWHSISWQECAEGILAKLKEELRESF